jgi:hypothetical protein
MSKVLHRAFSVVIFSTLLNSGCATDQAAKVRSDKPSTVGVWGGAYRPSAKIGIVSELGGLVSPQTDQKHVDGNGDIKDKRGEEANSQNIDSRESQEVDLGLHYYPSPLSAFFFGLAANRRKNVTKFDSPNQGSSLANPSYSNVQVSDDVVAVGPAMGWDWIWPNGVSVLWDFGPRWDVSKSRNMSDNSGSSDKIDVAKRDKLLKKIDNSGSLRLVDTHLIVGFSF